MSEIQFHLNMHRSAPLIFPHKFPLPTLYQLHPSSCSGPKLNVTFDLSFSHVPHLWARKFCWVNPPSIYSLTTSYHTSFSSHLSHWSLLPGLPAVYPHTVARVTLKKIKDYLPPLPKPPSGFPFNFRVKAKPLKALDDLFLVLQWPQTLQPSLANAVTLAFLPFFEKAGRLLP